MVDDGVRKSAVCRSAITTCSFICNIYWLIQDNRGTTQVIVVSLRNIALIRLVIMRDSEVVSGRSKVHWIATRVTNLFVMVIAI